VSISWVVRRAIEDYLHRHPQPSVRMPRLAARSLSALA
jgi:hypothetical protein